MRRCTARASTSAATRTARASSRPPSAPPPRAPRTARHPAPRIPSRRRMHVLDHYDAARIRALHDSGEFFWLDLDTPTAAELAELGEILDLPPLAVEDSQEFGQRAKIDDYGDH